MTLIKTMTTLITGHPLAAAAVSATALAVIVLAWRRLHRVLSGRQAEDVLTMVAATVATTVVMNGMWRFAGKVLHFSGPERVTMFAFLELAMLTEAFRARRNVRDSAARAEHAHASGGQPEPVTAGVDGAAVWALAVLSGLLSSLDSSSAAEAAARLTAPLVAAWLWERGLSLYRRKVTGRAIHWRFTLERVLVRLGLAEPAGRTTSEVAAHRYLAQLALAAKHTRGLRASAARGWRQRRASRRLDAAMARAVEHASLATDPGRQDALLAQMGALYGASALADLTPAVPWRERPALAPHPYAAHTRETAQSVRTEPPTRPATTARTATTAPVERAALINELARDIQRGRAAGTDWRPDYDALKGRNKGRPNNDRRARRPTRRVPIPPELVQLLREHIERFGVGADGRLFRSENGNPIQPSTWWQVWQKVRAFGLTPNQAATPLLRHHPYDLRHSGVTWRLNSGVPPTEVAAWAGHSVEVLMRTYAKCMTGLEDVWIKRMNDSLHLRHGSEEEAPE